MHLVHDVVAMVDLVEPVRTAEERLPRVSSGLRAGHSRVIVKASAFVMATGRPETAGRIRRPVLSRRALSALSHPGGTAFVRTPVTDIVS